MKGETADEIFSAAAVAREKAVKIFVRNSLAGIEDKDEPVFDTCGTGGSQAHKFNVSTITAFVVAASGIKVAKHGNRAVSSSCGSADILEVLGVKIDANPAVMQEAIKKTGIGFLFAPLYHPAFKTVAGVRKELGVRTIFNILGPLCNPAFADHQLLGVYDEKLLPVMADVFKKLGAKRVLIVYGKGVKDEISLCGETKAIFLHNKNIKIITLRPSDFGLKKIVLNDIQVSDSAAAVRIARDIFDGKLSPCRDIVLANAGACFYVLGKADDFKAGVKIAAELIDSGKVKAKFLEFKGYIDRNADDRR
jgi:anthranilate phosphoribosyltransferase